jgi:3D (Asp-Asp-Asp) domain-containing protein
MKLLTRVPRISFEKTKTVVSVAVLVAVTMSTMPIRSAEADVSSNSTSNGSVSAQVDEPGSTPGAVFTAPTYNKVTVLKEYKYVPMTAYTSRPEETDDSPFITADGSHVRDGIIAANFLPFGTKIRIPSLFGDKIFEVHDRMNKRYPYKADVWMEGYTDAIKFGVKYATIEVVKVETMNAANTQKVRPALSANRPAIIRK